MYSAHAMSEVELLNSQNSENRSIYDYTQICHNNLQALIEATQSDSEELLLLLVCVFVLLVDEDDELLVSSAQPDHSKTRVFPGRGGGGTFNLAWTPSRQMGTVATACILV